MSRADHIHSHVHYSVNICASARVVRIVCLTPILVNIEDARLVCLPLNIAFRIQCTYITCVFNFLFSNVLSYPAKPSYSHCAELGRSDCHFSTAARVKKTVTPPTDKTVTVLALVS